MRVDKIQRCIDEGNERSQWNDCEGSKGSFGEGNKGKNVKRLREVGNK